MDSFPGWKSQFTTPTKGLASIETKSHIFHGFGNCPVHERDEGEVKEWQSFYLRVLRSDCIGWNDGWFGKLLSLGVLDEDGHAFKLNLKNPLV